MKSRYQNVANSPNMTNAEKKKQKQVMDRYVRSMKRNIQKRKKLEKEFTLTWNNLNKIVNKKR